MNPIAELRSTVLPGHARAPVAGGWTELGFQKVGAKAVQVHEEAFAEGKTAAGPLVFRSSWE